MGVAEELRALKSKISELPKKYPAEGLTFGPGAGTAQEQVPTICLVIEDAVKALEKGLDVFNRPITKAQTADGLNRLVAHTRKPAFVGLLTGALSTNGISELEKCMNELERIAGKIK